MNLSCIPRRENLVSGPGGVRWLFGRKRNNSGGHTGLFSCQIMDVARGSVIWGFGRCDMFYFSWDWCSYVTGASYAQSSAANPLLLAAPFTISSTGDVSAVSASPSSTALSLSPAANASGSGESFAANPFSSSPAPAPVPDPQYVQGVFVNYNWQAYIGYTFTHFSAQGGISRNQNGFNWGIVRYFNSWFGIEGEMFATHDSPNNQSSWFLFGGGGPRFRWEARRGIEVFAHALVGYSHLTPQTAFGDSGSVRIRARWRRRLSHSLAQGRPSCRSGHDWNAIFR